MNSWESTVSNEKSEDPCRLSVTTRIHEAMGDNRMSMAQRVSIRGAIRRAGCARKGRGHLVVGVGAKAVGG
jgi:hypothetical protein